MTAPPPPDLANPLFLAGKAALACAIAMIGCWALGNPDTVSATFVAVLCVSPTVLTGVRRSTLQLVGSGIGGALGALAAAIGLPPGVGIPVAVGLAVLAAFRTGVGSAYLIAAFSALVVQAIPRGSPALALNVRIVAVLIAAAAAFVANVAVSARAYPAIFARRVARLDAYVAALLLAVAEHPSPDALLPAFGPIGALQAELASAIEELSLRRSNDLATLQAHARHADALRRLVHVAVDVAWAATDAGVPHLAGPLLAWAARGDGPPPAVDPVLTQVGARLVAAVADRS